MVKLYTKKHDHETRQNSVEEMRRERERERNQTYNFSFPLFTAWINRKYKVYIKR